MKLEEIKKLSKTDLIKRYPYLHSRDYSGKLYYLDNGEPGVETFENGWKDLILIWAEKVKPIFDSWSKEDQEGFYITELKEKYGSIRLYLSFTNKEIGDLVSMLEHLSYCTCPCCGKLTKTSNGKKLLAWKTKGWIGYYCKNCAKRILREDLKDYYKPKKLPKPFKFFFEEEYTKVEESWFTQYKRFSKEETITVKLDCRDFFEGVV